MPSWKTEVILENHPIIGESVGQGQGEKPDASCYGFAVGGLRLIHCRHSFSLHK